MAYFEPQNLEMFISESSPDSMPVSLQSGDSALGHPQICSELGVTEEQLDEITLSENTRHITQFLPYQRAMHVFSGQHLPRVLICG